MFKKILTSFLLLGLLISQTPAKADEYYNMSYFVVSGQDYVFYLNRVLLANTQTFTLLHPNADLSVLTNYELATYNPNTTNFEIVNENDYMIMGGSGSTIITTLRQLVNPRLTINNFETYPGISPRAGQYAIETTNTTNDKHYLNLDVAPPIMIVPPEYQGEEEEPDPEGEANVEIDVDVLDFITISSDNPDIVAIQPSIGTTTEMIKADASTNKQVSANVTVNTNAASGFALSAKGSKLIHIADAATALKQVGEVVGDGAIKAWDADDGFGVCVSSAVSGVVAGFTADCTTDTSPYLSLHANTATEIVSTTAYSSEAVNIPVFYRIDVARSQKAGRYTGGITYTATVNP